MLGAKGIALGVVEVVILFAQGQPRSDDFTLVILKAI